MRGRRGKDYGLSLSRLPRRRRRRRRRRLNDDACRSSAFWRARHLPMSDGWTLSRRTRGGNLRRLSRAPRAPAITRRAPLWAHFAARSVCRAGDFAGVTAQARRFAQKFRPPRADSRTRVWSGCAARPSGRRRRAAPRQIAQVSSQETPRSDPSKWLSCSPRFLSSRVCCVGDLTGATARRHAGGQCATSASTPSSSSPTSSRREWLRTGALTPDGGCRPCVKP